MRSHAVKVHLRYQRIPLAVVKNVTFQQKVTLDEQLQAFRLKLHFQSLRQNVQLNQLSLMLTLM